MISLTRTYQVILLFLALCYCLITGCVYANAEESPFLESDTRIATVGDKSIFYRDIKLSPEATRLYFQLRTGKSPTEENETDLKEIRHERELQNLAGKLSEIITQSLFIALEISASQEEIQTYMARLSLDDSYRDSALEIRRKITEILDALKAVEAGADTEIVYKNSLADKITSREWLVYQDSYKDPRRKKSLESMAVITAADLREAMETNARQNIKNKKLAQWVDAEIGKKDPRFIRMIARQEVLLKENSKSSLSDADSKELQRAQSYIASAQNSWWTDYYKRNVTIKQPRFLDVLKILRNPINLDSGSKGMK